MKTADLPTVWVLQHIPCETPGTIAQVLRTEGVQPHTIRVFKGEPVPTEMDGVAGLIVMGGPMGVYESERYPFLLDEMRLIERCLEGGKPVLGICLGSQLLAASLGASVTPGRQKEIGWHRVSLTDASRTDPLWEGIEPDFVAYHWHGDVFELPGGAMRLMSSELTECQAFRYGHHAYGLLCHVEVTQRIIQDMVREFAAELEQAGIDGGDIIGSMDRYLPQLQKIGRLVCQRWVHLLREVEDR